MPEYIHELGDWPAFRWDQKALEKILTEVRHRQGRLLGRMQNLGITLRNEAVLVSLTEEVLNTSEIEGEVLDPQEVRSSIARRLGLEAAALKPADRAVEGVVDMMLDATQHYDMSLTEDRLFGWHASLFPTGYSGLSKIVVGNWRTAESGPMQVVSGPIGRPKVHFEAPPANLLPKEMDAFLSWFGEDKTSDPVLKAAIAHLWFVTIHPFADGNGRIARAIADMQLTRSEETSQRFYSMSAQIRVERAAYYKILETTQKGDLDITAWLTWFLECLGRAFDGAEVILAAVLKKAAFWKMAAYHPINERQRKVINLMLDGFEGKLTSSKWAALTKTSQDTANRDIADLVARNILMRSAAGGRSTSYSLADFAAAESL
ncbi:MAG: Fic family protein [Alphaproteobacteria bacterium]|nr:Fic family protein [Alphaproteobacteria bacterium]